MSDHVTVIPVFNEASTIGSLVVRAACHGPVVVVDDGSNDGSAGAAAAAGASVIHTGHRRGKGAALRVGFEEALRRGAQRVVTLDGDGQHDPEDIPRLVQKIRKDFGPIYGLINNAALGTEGVLAIMHNSQIEELVRVNTISPIVLTIFGNSRASLSNSSTNFPDVMVAVWMSTN